MKPSQVNLLILVLTVCIAFLAWGTIIVLRTVKDANYHPQTAAQQKIEAYKSCVYPINTKSDDCRALVENK